jgi:hypothetical protein
MRIEYRMEGWVWKMELVVWTGRLFILLERMELRQKIIAHWRKDECNETRRGVYALIFGQKKRPLSDLGRAPPVTFGV